MQAETPEPQDVMIGLSSATPALWKAAAISSGARRRPPSSTNSRHGKLRAPGMWPARSPARGSGTAPAKRVAGRASTTWVAPDALAASTVAASTVGNESKVAEKARRLPSARAALGRMIARQPRLEAAFEEVDARRSVVLQHPPCTGATDEIRRIVDDQRHRFVEAERAGHPPERLGIRQHVRQARSNDRRSCRHRSAPRRGCAPARTARPRSCPRRAGRSSRRARRSLGRRDARRARRG